MANSDKNIVITPNIGSTTSDPQIVFSGASSTVGPQNITLRTYPANNGTVSFEGSAGQLLSVTNSLSGTIFSVNDVSGVPSIEVTDSGTIRFAQFSGNVGIGLSAVGVTNPSARLHAAVGSSGAGTLAQLMIGYDSTSTNYYDAATHIFRNGSANEQMRLNSSGNLGIGTNSPFTRLEVNSGSAAAPVVSIYATKSTYGAGDVVGTLGFGSNGSGNDIQAATISGLNETVNNSANGALVFATRTSGTVGEKMRLDSSGNLGLGVTPSAWGNSYKAIQLNGGAIAGYNNTTLDLYSNAYDSSVGVWIYVNNSAATRYNQNDGNHRWFTAPSGTAGNAISFTQAMTLDTATANRSTLTLNNTDVALLAMAVGGTRRGYLFQSATETILFNEANGPMLFGTNALERMRLDSSGNLGIGTNSPGSLDGTTKLVVGTGSGSPVITVYGGNATYSGINFADGITGNEKYRGFIEYDHATDAMRVGTSGGTKATLDSSGNLGLGTTPSAWSSGGMVTFKNDAGLSSTGADINFGANYYYNSGWKYIGTGYATQYYQTAGQHRWYIAPNNTGSAGDPISFTQAMTLDASGSLGVGATSIQGGINLEKSSSANTIAAAASIILSNRNAASGTFLAGGVFSNTYRDITASQYTAGIWFEKQNSVTAGANASRGTIVFGTNDFTDAGVLPTERMRLDASGNLGLGVTPSAWVTNRRILQIGGGAAAGLALNGTSGVSEFFANTIRNAADGLYRYFATAPASYVDFNNTAAGGWAWNIAPSGTAGDEIFFTQAMTLDASGRLGIGVTVTTPNFILDVAGDDEKQAEFTRTGTTTGASYARFVNAGGSFYIGVESSAGDRITNSLLPYAASLGTSNATSLVFGTNNIARAIIDSSGNLGLGVTPSAWGSNYKALENAAGFYGNYSTNVLLMGQNWSDSGAGSYLYKTTGFASYYSQANGEHRFYNAPSGTAGQTTTVTSGRNYTITAAGGTNYISFGAANNDIGTTFTATSGGTGNGGGVTENLQFTQAMTLDASGNLGVGTTSPRNPGAGYKGITLNGTTSGFLDFNTNGTRVLTIFGQSNDGWIANPTSTGALLFATNETERARIKSTGQFRFVPIASNPGGEEAGDVYYNSTSNTVNIYNGSSWVAPITSYPQSGIVVSSGNGWGTSLTAPAGNLVGTTAEQTLESKTITNLVFSGNYTEDVYTIVDGTSVDINPANGTIQLWTLGANRIPTATNFGSGQSVTLMINDGSAFTINWATNINVTWVGGSQPTLATTGYTVIILWKVSATVYGSLVGSVA